MVDHVLSAQARLVLHETTGRSAATGGTTLGRIQRILGNVEAGVAEVVVLDLDAGGYVQDYGEGKLVRIRASPADSDIGRFIREVERTAAEITEMVLEVGGYGASREARPGVSPTLAFPAAEWIAVQGHRAQTMLEIAVEHGLCALACSFGRELALLWHAAGRHDEALATLESAEAAERGQYKQRMARLQMCRTGVLIDQDRHDEAEAAATAAIVYSLEAAATPGLVASAYAARAAARERAGTTVWAVDDRELAVMAASPDRTRAYSPELEARKAEETDRRYLTTVNGLHLLIAAYARRDAGAIVDTDALVALVEEAMFDLRQADPTGSHIAAVIRTARDLLPSLLAAEIAEHVGRAAKRHYLYDIARASYRDSAELYEAGGNKVQVGRVRELLNRLGMVPNGSGFTRSN